MESMLNSPEQVSIAIALFAPEQSRGILETWVRVVFTQFVESVLQQEHKSSSLAPDTAGLLPALWRPYPSFSRAEPGRRCKQPLVETLAMHPVSLHDGAPQRVAKQNDRFLATKLGFEDLLIPNPASRFSKASST